MNDQNNNQNNNQNDHYVNAYTPPPIGNDPTAEPSDDSTFGFDGDTNQGDSGDQSANDQSMGSGSSSSESLEDQNIFYLLGVDDGTDEQRESFLDELQQVIWEDFLENDVELLLTTHEMGELRSLMEKQSSSDMEQQEEIVVYLEKLIPDLEEIMLEKALELKGDLFKERIAGMKEYFADKSESLRIVQEAETLLGQDKWYSAAKMLNDMPVDTSAGQPSGNQPAPSL